MPRKIIIGFSKPRAKFVPLSWLIRLVEGTKYSHTYVRWYSDNFKLDMAYEAAGNGLTFLGPEAFNAKTNIIKEFEFEITNDEYRKLIRFCAKYAGSKYGKLQLVGVLISRLLKRRRNLFTEGWVCTELVWFVMQVILNINTGLNRDLVGLRELYKLLDEGRA